MMSVKKLTLLEQRRALRQQLFAQRQLIAQQLDLQAEADNYPRSATMRFLTGKSGLGTKLVKSAATLLGMSVAKSLAAPLIVSLFTGHRRR